MLCSYYTSFQSPRAIAGSMFVRIKELRSGLGRKFFVLVFLAALLPMLLFASFSYNYVGNALLRESDASLQKEARFYSTILYERLLLSGSRIAAAYKQRAAGVSASEPALIAFKRLSLVDWVEFEALSSDLPPPQQLAARTRLEQGLQYLLTTTEGPRRCSFCQPDRRSHCRSMWQSWMSRICLATVNPVIRILTTVSLAVDHNLCIVPASMRSAGVDLLSWRSSRGTAPIFRWIGTTAIPCSR